MQIAYKKNLPGGWRGEKRDRDTSLRRALNSLVFSPGVLGDCQKERVLPLSFVADEIVHIEFDILIILKNSIVLIW